MTIKKTLFTVGTATAVAIAGTGVASAQETGDTSGSLPSSSESNTDGDANGSAILGSIQGSISDGALDPSGSIDAGGFFNQIWADNEEGVISLAGVAAVLAGTAVVAGNVNGIATAYQNVIAASDAWQGVVSDTLGYLDQQGISLPQ